MRQSLLDMGYISSDDDEAAVPAPAPTTATGGAPRALQQQSLSPQLRQVDDNLFEMEVEAENAADVRRLLEETIALRGLQVDAIELLEEQGKLVDEADQAVGDAAESAKEATKSITEARKRQKKAMWLVRACVRGTQLRVGVCSYVAVVVCGRA
jgi:hypothetical protein